MADLRKDPVTGRWVIIAEQRARRPAAFLHDSGGATSGAAGAGNGSARLLSDAEMTPVPDPPAAPPTAPPSPLPPAAAGIDTRPCPFCPGSEHETPEESLSYREASSSANEPGWWVRVMPNKFPALDPEGEIRRKGEGMYDRMTGAGVHEVVVESPSHTRPLAEMPVKQVREVLWAFRDRCRTLANDPRLRYILVFKNHGRAAGASIDHPHSQIIGLPIVPKRVQEELDGALRYMEYKERCVFCDMVDEELRDRVRLVSENKRFLSVQPFASRFPFETCILPRRHETHFDEISEEAIDDLAVILKETLWRIRRALNDPPFNFVIHTSPLDQAKLPHYHWHIEIMPKLTQVAGFEWGSGFYINPVAPEEAARTLREITLLAGAGQADAAHAAAATARGDAVQ